jgi:hypothetical protein
VKAFIDWVLAQRVRPILLAVVAAPLLQPVAAAFIALETTRREFAGGVICGLGALAGVLGIAAIAGADTNFFAAIGVVCAVSGVGIGVLIRRAGNLVLAFQAAMLVALMLLAAIWIVGFDVRSLFAPAVQDFIELLGSNDMPPADVAVIEERGAAVVFSALVFWQLVGTLLLGYWWFLLATRQRRFGQEFRRLALGRVLGAIATALIVLALAFDFDLVQNLAPLAGYGFILQGVAVVHAWAHAKRWPPGLVAPLYVLMLVPVLNVLVVLPLGLVGVVDNWFDLRALIRPQT